MQRASAIEADVARTEPAGEGLAVFLGAEHDVDRTLRLVVRRSVATEGAPHDVDMGAPDRLIVVIDRHVVERGDDVQVVRLGKALTEPARAELHRQRLAGRGEDEDGDAPTEPERGAHEVLVPDMGRKELADDESVIELASAHAVAASACGTTCRRQRRKPCTQSARKTT